MLRIKLPLIWIIAAFLPCCCFGEFRILGGSASPDKKLALAAEVPERLSGDGEFISLVRLPNKRAIGVPVATRGPLALPDRGGCVWNKKAACVAFVQSGIPWSWTMVFQYSCNSLEELPLPDFSGLPRRWFIKATDFKRSYIIARRWHGRNRLELTVSGVAVFNGGKIESDYLDYGFIVVVQFTPNGTSRIIRVTEDN